MLFVPAAVFTARTIKLQLDRAEAKAQRNDMIEMDVRIRNISSMLSLGHAEGLYQNFNRLARIETNRPNSMRKGYQSLYKKWTKHGLNQYMENIIKTAKRASATLRKTYKTPADVDWTSFEKEFESILTNCRKCHTATASNPR